MKFMTILLRESRKDDLMKKYQNKFSEENLSNIFSNPFIIKTSYKYADFILKHLNPNYSFSELDEVIDALQKFDKIQSRLERTDINSYKGIFDLMTTVNDYVKKDEKPKSKKIYEDDKFIVVEPQNFVASCKYGAKTRWCTTQKDNTDFFNRYTSGNQGLYYVISRRDLDENLYKIAVHFDKNGGLNIYDASDSTFGKREIALFKSAYPEMWNAIESYHEEKHPDTTSQTIIHALSDNQSTQSTIEIGGAQIKIVLEGFEFVEEQRNTFLGNNYLRIYDITNQPPLLDEYMVFIACEPKKMDELRGVDFGFHLEGGDDEPRLNLELESVSGDAGFVLQNISSLSFSMSTAIMSQVIRNLRKNDKLLQYAHKSPVRYANIRYGYTFGKNKGLIKKLVDWLDKGTVGTKLDFLTDIGKLDKKLEDGKALYSHKDKNSFSPSSNWRGHFATFFAAAKQAGILDYRKIGNQFLLKKGRNYDAFKEGRLKAI